MAKLDLIYKAEKFKVMYRTDLIYGTDLILDQIRCCAPGERRLISPRAARCGSGGENLESAS